jgi:MFS family permease
MAVPATATPPTASTAEARLSAGKHLGLSAWWFAYQMHWAALATVLIQSQCERLALAHPGGPTKAEIGGWVFGFGSIVGAITPPIVGALSDRSLSSLGRRRPYVISGTLVNILGLYLLWLAFRANSLPGYVAAFLVIQLGSNIALGAFSGIIPDIVPEAQRGTASGYMAALSQLGTIAGLVTAGILMAKQHPRDLACVTVISAALLLFAAITVTSVREVPQTKAAPLDLRALLREFWIDPRQYPDFAWVWATRALFTSGWWMIQPILVYFLGDVVRAHNPEGTFALLGGVVLLGATITGLLGGVLSDRFGRKRIVFLAGMIMTVAAVAFALCTFTGHAVLPAVFGIAVFWGVGYGAYISVDWALGTDVLPNKEDAGKDMGIWHLSMVLPQAVAPPIAAAILSRFVTGAHAENYTPTGYTLVFLAAAVILTLSATLIFRVRKAR